MSETKGCDLHVEHLSVSLDRGTRQVVRDVNLHILGGEALGLVGESGSGKTLTCRSILRLLPPGAEVTGKIDYGGRSLLDLSERQMRSVRGSEIAMIFQDPMTALNPLVRVGTSVAQVIKSHEKVKHRDAARRAVGALERVGIRNASARASAYPHEFSGGMRQRVLTAMAMAAQPTLLLADEPTTALDVIVQAGVLEMFAQMRREVGMSLLLVSHDFAVVASLCERLAVMYAGEIVEDGTTQEVLFQPSHPYTFGLIRSIPATERGRKLDSIPGSPPEPHALPVGCAFAPRCRLAVDQCRAHPIPLVDVSPTHRARCIRIDALDELRSEVATDNGTSRIQAARG